MTDNDSKPCLSYLNKLADQYNNAYQNSIGKKPISTEKIVLSEKFKAFKFKVNDRIRIAKCKNIFRKGYTESWLREIIIVNSVLKTNPWSYKIKYLNGEKIIGNFMKKNCC